MTLALRLRTCLLLYFIVVEKYVSSQIVTARRTHIELAKSFILNLDQIKRFLVSPFGLHELTDFLLLSNICNSLILLLIYVLSFKSLLHNVFEPQSEVFFEFLGYNLDVTARFFLFNTVLPATLIDATRRCALRPCSVAGIPRLEMWMVG